MKRSLIILVLIAPALVSVVFVLNPQADTASPSRFSISRSLPLFPWPPPSFRWLPAVL